MKCGLAVLLLSSLSVGGIIIGMIFTLTNIPPNMIINRVLEPTIATITKHTNTPFTLFYQCNCDFTGEYCQHCNQTQYYHDVTVLFWSSLTDALASSYIRLGNDSYPDIINPVWNVNTYLDVWYNQCYYYTDGLCFYATGSKPVYLNYLPVDSYPGAFIAGITMLSICGGWILGLLIHLLLGVVVAKCRNVATNLPPAYGQHEHDNIVLSARYPDRITV